jgi:hypothetical protein
MWLSKTMWLFEIFICLQSKNFRQINDIRDTGPDTENTDHGPYMGFNGPLVNQSEFLLTEREVCTEKYWT